MTIDVDAIFRYKAADCERLAADGFAHDGDTWQKRLSIMDGQFWMDITVRPPRDVDYRVIDRDSGEEYVLVHATGAQGSFVGAVRAACEEALNALAQQCFATEHWRAPQTKRLLAAIDDTYGVQPEYLWADTPNCAALRRKDNAKWFAAVLTAKRDRLGLAGDGSVELLDLKAPPETVQALLQRDGYHPAYHMNKKHWFTVCLNDSLPDETLCALVAQSYACVGK